MLTYLTRGRLSPTNDAVFLVTQGRLAAVGLVPPVPPVTRNEDYTWFPTVEGEFYSPEIEVASRVKLILHKIVSITEEIKKNSL